MKKVTLITIAALGMVGVANAATIFEATTANTVLVNNEFNATNGVPTLTGATPDLVYSNPNGLNNNGGFASTDSLDVLMGSSLTVSNELLFSAMIDSITTNTFKAGAVVFGMSPSATFQPADNLLFQVNDANNKSQMQNIAGVDGGAKADFYIIDASMADGFGISLTANNGGYTFALTNVEAVVAGVTNTTATFSGTFATGEFTNYFSAGHFYLTSQTDGDPSPQVLDISSATLSVEELSEVPEPTDPPVPPEPPVVDPEDIIFVATPTNSTFVFNAVQGNPASGTLTGTAVDLVITNDGVNFGMVGFASTSDINTMNGTDLTDKDQVVFKATVTGITGLIRANGVEFGMSTNASFRPDDNLIYSMQADNKAHVFQANAFIADDAVVTLSGKSSEASMKDGFDITLVANNDGYTFFINGIIDSANANATNIVQTGTFTGTEFLDYFSGGHFYLAVQKFNSTTEDTVMNISETYLAVQKRFPIDVPILAIDALSASQVVISWNSNEGAVYSVQSKLNLITDGWGTVSSNLLATPPMNTYTDTVDNVVEFYQVEGE